MAKRIVLYSMRNCPHCDMANRYLTENKIKFRLCDVRSANGQKEFFKTNMRGVPVLKIGDRLLNGFSRERFHDIYDE